MEKIRQFEIKEWEHPFHGSSEAADTEITSFESVKAEKEIVKSVTGTKMKVLKGVYDRSKVTITALISKKDSANIEEVIWSLQI